MLGISTKKSLQAQLARQFCLPRCVISTGKVGVKGDVRGNVQRRDQIELLKDQANSRSPISGSFAIIKCCDVLPIHHHRPAIGMVKPARQMKKRALAATRFTCQGDAFVRCDVQVDSL
ncbi:hypothetical protein ASC97_31555 [Rhizobium sp. Root1203]|nr:hypothetical protein ASC97_31555 [Rhizobium sp. Root1203]